MSSTFERRAHRRLPALSNRSSLEWWDGRATRMIATTVLNISEGGVLVELDQHAPIANPVWLRLDAPARTNWIAGRVVHRDGGKVAGIRFDDRCPRDFYEAALQGIDFGHLI